MKEIFERVSVRSFTDERVSDKDVELILKAAMAAPSAGNQQPWEFIVVSNHDVIEALSEVSPYAKCAAKAPLVIVPCMRTKGLRFPMYDQIDLSIATEHILLAATSLSLGGVWLGIAPIEERMEKTAHVLNLDENLRPFALVAIGHPAVNNKQKDRFDPSRIHYVK